MRKTSGMLITSNTRDYELNTDGIFDFSKEGTIALIDADPIAYAAAAACDRTTHKVHLSGVCISEVEGGVTELYRAFSLKDKSEFDEMLKNNPDVTYDKIVDSDDSAHMNHTIKAMIRKIIKTLGAKSMRLFLTDGSSNFRLTENISTILKYKGNRSPDSKPKLLGKAREYMLNELGAEMCVGLEADDRLSIEHQKYWDISMEDALMFYCDDPDVIKVNHNNIVEKKAMELTQSTLVTIDKDIKMRAGKFMNPDQDLGVEEIFPLGHLFIDQKSGSKKLRFSGLKGFYAQLLMGDNCDNIPSVYFCGDVRVFEVLKDCNTEEDLFKSTLREIYEGFHREHINTLDADINNRVEDAIASGASGSKSNRTKLRAKFKKLLMDNVAYCDKHYYHWSEYLLKEDGTVSRELKDPNSASVLTISPINYMTEVARLIYMLTIEPSKDGSHLWIPPNDEWVKEVQAEYVDENLMRIPMDWVL